MTSEKGQSNYQRGILSLVILAMLSRADMYGYEIVQQIEQISGGRIVTKEGSMYPVLYKLLEQGYVSSRKVLVGKRMARIYYHLEPEGEERLQELIAEYDSVTRGVYQIIDGTAHDEK